MSFTRRDFIRTGFFGLSYPLVFSQSTELLSKREEKNAEALLVELERRACLFLYEQADPATGLVKDRARHTGIDTHTVSSIAAVGFALDG